jgi:hypothetical protein
MAIGVLCRRSQNNDNLGRIIMSGKFKAAIAVFCGALLVSATSFAQDHTRNWDVGYVVAVTYVHIKPGMTNAYMNDIGNLWRKFNEQQKKDGDIVDYKVYSNTAAREGEPDMILTVTYKNWATFDRDTEYFEKLSEKLMGSLDNMREAAIDREDIRTIGSTYVLQEMNFTD